MKEEAKVLLEVINLQKSYNKTLILKGVSFKVFPGQVHIFAGSNGAGKTTTIKCLVDAYKKWTGTILIAGLPNHLPQPKQKIAYLPELPVFPPGMRVKDYLYSFAILFNKKSKDAVQQVTNLMQKLGIENLANLKTRSLSSGQKRKVFIAQSLLTDPDLYIMDEPTAHMDPAAREEFYKFVLSERQRGKSFFISTHILDEVDRLTDYVTVIEQGKIVFSGPKSNQDLRSQYFASLTIAEKPNTA